jgi:hypothetical protein
MRIDRTWLWLNIGAALLGITLVAAAIALGWR